MKLTVVTGWAPSGWKQYGKLFLQTFCRHWPEDVRLVVYVEEIQDWSSYAGNRHIEQRLLQSIPEAAATLARYDNTLHRGKEPNPAWKERAVQAGYNWRYDAWKFCRQGLIPWDVAWQMKPGLLLWLDGDVVTTATVPPGFIEKLLPPGYEMAYLGREPKHSEIGFQLYRVMECAPLLRRFSALYTTGAILAEKEWHSAYAFDLARKRSPEVRAFNMTPGGSGNVWTTTPLQRYMTHLKGDLKNDANRKYGLKA